MTRDNSLELALGGARMTLGRPGDLLADRYRLDRFVGGSGSVERWRAYDERLARPVTARLEPAPDDAADRQESTAAAQAAQAALTKVAQLNHPGVAAVYDVGRAEGLRGGSVGYAISEWTEGRTLGQVMAIGPQPWPRTADWGRQISGALAALHGIGIAHGVLSPESVAIHDDRQVKIFDVGLDSATEDDGDGDGGGGAGATDADGADAGAGDYADRELPDGAPDDVYALGFMLWEATVGAAPEYVIPGANAPESAAANEARSSDDGPPTEPTVPVSGTERAGIDEQPLLATGAPAEMAALLSQMLAANPALRPTATEAEQRFLPFASAERIGDTLPGVAVPSAQTQVLGPPIAARAAGGSAAAAAAAESAKAERSRRRGALLGLALLVAAALAGLGFLLANLNSHSGSPNDVNTVIPTSSPGMVTLPNGSLSPAPSLTPTAGGHATSAAPSAPASSASASPSPTPPPTSASPPASATPTGSSGGGGASSPAGPGGSSGTPTAGPSSHISPLASTPN